MKEGFGHVACYFRVENVKLGCDVHGQVELILHMGGNVLTVLLCCVYYVDYAAQTWLMPQHIGE